MAYERYRIVYHVEDDKGWAISVVATDCPVRELTRLEKANGWTLELVREVVCLLERL